MRTPEMNSIVARAIPIRALLSALPLLALAGCVSFGAKPPAQLLSIASQARVAPSEARSIATGTAISVVIPDGARKLETPRVPVQVDDTSVAYVQKAQWIDVPRRMFRALLAETLKAGGTPVLDPDQFSITPHVQLSGTLTEFGVDARTNSAIVTLDAVLTKPGDKALTTQRFTASEPIGGKVDATNAARAINAAANKVAADVAAWVGAK